MRRKSKSCENLFDNHRLASHAVYSLPRNTIRKLEDIYASTSTDDLMEQIMSAPLVRCDEIPWEMFGISMAGWNMLASLAFMGLWMLAYRKL